jgi:hypothetical protein
VKIYKILTKSWIKGNKVLIHKKFQYLKIEKHFYYELHSCVFGSMIYILSSFNILSLLSLPCNICDSMLTFIIFAYTQNNRIPLVFWFYVLKKISRKTLGIKKNITSDSRNLLPHLELIPRSLTNLLNASK